MRIVLDTSVLIAVFKASHSETASRQVLRRVLQGKDKAVVGAALWSEWRDVANRAALFKVRSGELRWPHLRMLTPKDYLEIADVPSRY